MVLVKQRQSHNRRVKMGRTIRESIKNEWDMMGHVNIRHHDIINIPGISWDHEWGNHEHDNHTIYVTYENQ